MNAPLSSGSFAEHFDRIAVISLARRQDRRDRLAAHLRKLGLAGPGTIRWQDAVDGHSAAKAPPDGWSAGPGAWGCLLSHLQVLHEALHDGIERLLILEDDVLFSPHTARVLPHLMQALPSDWGQFYLGGQHLRNPSPSHSPLLWQAGNINRTHAWAAHRPWLPAIIAHLERWEDYTRPVPKGEGWHLDHQLGAAHEAGCWPAFCSSWWLAGQAADQSDISAKTLRRYWWHSRRFALHLPFVYLTGRTPRSVEDRLYLAPADGAFTAALKSDGSLFAWLHRIASFALDHGCLPGWRSQRLKPERVQQLWPAGLAAIPASLPEYPFDGLFPHPLSSAFPANSIKT